MSAEERKKIEEIKAAYAVGKTALERTLVLNDSRWPIALRIIAATEIRS